MVTQKGELSIEPGACVFSPSDAAAAREMARLTDVELRYRQRYVDLVANPEVKEIFNARSIMVRELRRYLDDLDFSRSRPRRCTPSSAGGGKAVRHAPQRARHAPFHAHRTRALLEALVVGHRAGVRDRPVLPERGNLDASQPEFTMLEAYRAYATYETLMDMTEDMLRTVDARLAAAMPEAYARWTARGPSRSRSLSCDFR